MGCMEIEKVTFTVVADSDLYKTMLHYCNVHSVDIQSLLTEALREKLKYDKPVTGSYTEYYKIHGTRCTAGDCQECDQC